MTKVEYIIEIDRLRLALNKAGCDIDARGYGARYIMSVRSKLLDEIKQDYFALKRLAAEFQTEENRINTIFINCMPSDSRPYVNLFEWLSEVVQEVIDADPDCIFDPNFEAVTSTVMDYIDSGRLNVPENIVCLNPGNFIRLLNLLQTIYNFNIVVGV